MKFRRALITGASGGIGSGIALKLAANGVDIIVHGRDVTALEKIRVGVKNCLVLSGDLSCDRVIDDLVFQSADIDLLINCAGFARSGPFYNQPWSDISEQLNVNLIAVTKLCHRFLRLMSEAGGGTILNIGSSASFGAAPNLAVYAAAKSYVQSLSRSLQCESKDVRVKCLIPGPTNTAFAFRAQIERRSKGLDPDVVVKHALNLLQSDRARALSGNATAFKALIKFALPDGLQCFLQKRFR